MRFALILFSFLFLPIMASANDGPLAMAPWITPENPSAPETDIQPKPLSLSDLEDMELEPDKAKPVEKTSPLEILYSERIIDQLEQFGYDFFDKSHLPTNSIPAGSVQNNYILSAGDELRIILRGQVNLRQDITIDNQGQLIVEDLPPILAAGRSVAAVQNDLREEIKTIHNTKIYVSLASIRQIGVLVVGHVHKPGRKSLTGFHTALDAITAAGGIQKDGSLRQIKLVRKGRSSIIDLYQLMMANGGKADTLLKDGDRLIVPPIGPTMAITGSVKRPAIYEIRKGEKITLHQALSLAGGVLTPGQNRFIKLETTNTGEETVQNIVNRKDRIFGDGTILNVAQSKRKKASEVQLSGHTRQPGPHDFNKKRTLSALINDEKVLGNDIYPLIGVIERRNAEKFTKELIAFSPYQVLHKQYDRPLNDGDTVKLFSMNQIRALEKDQPLLQEASLGEDHQKEIIEDPILAAFLKERSVFVRGAVRQEGSYPVTQDASLENILAVAGGLSLEANKENIEISNRASGRKTINMLTENPAEIFLQSGDTIRANQRFHKIADQSVMIIGEVNHPGRYDLMPGDTMSKLIKRAGGLSDQAYPDGAIFSRKSERKREESRYKAQAQDLSMKLAASMQNQDDDQKPNMAQIQTTQNLIARLKAAKAVGRITVEADPASLKADPEQDILLEAGDKIFIPKRPLTVRVAGEVLSSASLQFRKGKEPQDYINQAGGTTYYADTDRTFVVYPDGSAQPLSISMWNHSPTFIPPGSTIIVPRDPKPFDFIESAERVSQILANLAISGLYIEAIGDDD
jgi:protein involved in polysaccharide export with SLBB domain